MKITYNSPVILTFALISTIVMLIDDNLNRHFAEIFFSVAPGMDFANPISYFRLASHALGHGGWEHLIGNMVFILLLGPMLEEKYGSKLLLAMILVTALVTGILNISLFPTGLLGASGIVFMLIILSSLTNFKAGQIPLTFILVCALFLGKEIFASMESNNISEFAHIIGGICGSVFGYLLADPKTRNAPVIGFEGAENVEGNYNTVDKNKYE